MIKRDTLLLCEVVLERYLDVLAEHPDAMTPDYKALLVDAYADVRRARLDDLLAVSRAVAAVPTETDQASLLSVVARASAPPSPA